VWFAACLIVGPPTVLGQPPVTDPGPVGWIWHRESVRQAPTPYVPQEGDLLFFSARAPLQTAGYVLIGSGHPLHCGVVLRQSDGELGILESGGGDDMRVIIRPVDWRLLQYNREFKGSVIWVRPIRRRLDADESFRLTQFAESQIGKPFVSNLRFALFALPGRPLPPTRTDQSKWFCSEIVAATLREAGILAPGTRTSALVPTDLFEDKTLDLSDQWQSPHEWTAGPELPEKRPWLAPKRPR